jgi:formate--tetrahydrofolate ligase
LHQPLLYDTDEEIGVIRKAAEAAGARVAVSKHWEKGGEGAIELAEAVAEACEEKPAFRFLYPLEMSIKERISLIAQDVYGADGVSYSADAEKSSP